MSHIYVHYGADIGLTKLKSIIYIYIYWRYITKAKQMCFATLILFAHPVRFVIVYKVTRHSVNKWPRLISECICI